MLLFVGGRVARALLDHLDRRGARLRPFARRRAIRRSSFWVLTHRPRRSRPSARPGASTSRSGGSSSTMSRACCAAISAARCSTERDVLPLVLERVPATLAIMLPALMLSIGIGVPAGAYAALKRDTAADRIVMLGAVAGLHRAELRARPRAGARLRGASLHVCHQAAMTVAKHHSAGRHARGRVEPRFSRASRAAPWSRCWVSPTSAPRAPRVCSGARSSADTRCPMRRSRS